MAGGGGGGDGEPEFQVAPMIDVLLVLLIFFMSTTVEQSMKVDKSVVLPVTPHGKEQEDKVSAGLINIALEANNLPRYRLDDIELAGTDGENPTVKGSAETLIDLLKKRKGNNDKFRLLIRADKRIQAKYIQKALEWGAAAGIDNIAFSGQNAPS